MCGRWQQTDVEREKTAEASAAVSAGGGENVPEASDIPPPFRETEGRNLGGATSADVPPKLRTRPPGGRACFIGQDQ